LFHFFEGANLTVYKEFEHALLLNNIKLKIW